MQNILENISLISLNISLWQGDKALKKEDLASNGVDVTRLPPGKLASLGCKRTIGKEATKDFISIKRAAQAACSRYGIKFGDGGYAVPNEMTEDVCDKLETLKLRFIYSKKDFLDNYEAMTEDWINQNDYEWRDAIRKSVDAPEKVAAVLSFNFSAYTINPVEGVFNGLEDEVDGLFAQLCKEVRTLASVTLKTSYFGKDSVGKRALRPIKSIRDKLSALKFLDPSIDQLVSETTDCISSASIAISANPDNVLDKKMLNETVGLLTKLSTLGLKIAFPEPCYAPEETQDEEEACGVDSNPVVAPAIDIPDWDF